MNDPLSKPFSDEKRWIVIYPAYLNSRKTLFEGRRLRKDKSIDSPTTQEIFDVLNSSGLNVKLEKSKMYPRDPARDTQFQGRVRVQLKNDDGSLVDSNYPSRESIMLLAAETIPKLKSRLQRSASMPAEPVQVQKGGGKKKKK